MLEVRSGCFRQAEEMVTEALDVYFATGRLWATLILMKNSMASTAEGFQVAHESFCQALSEIPKSGEVWCEGARIAMANHPANSMFNLEEAERYLLFAV